MEWKQHSEQRPSRCQPCPIHSCCSLIPVRIVAMNIRALHVAVQHSPHCSRSSGTCILASCDMSWQSGGFSGQLVEVSRWSRSRDSKVPNVWNSGPVTCHLSLVIQGIRVDGTRAAYGGRSRNFARLAGANNTSKSQQPCRLSDNYHFTSIHTIDSPLHQHVQVVTELHRICLPETERAQILIKTQTRSAVYGRRSRTRRRMSM